MTRRFKVGDKAIVTGFAPWNGSLVTITSVNEDGDPADYYVSRTLPEGVVDYTTASLDDSELTPATVENGDVFAKASDLEWEPSKKKGFARRRYGR